MDTRAERPHVRLPADVSHRRRRAARPARCCSSGGSVVIREKFSAREFWDDVVRWDCTLFQYIGELCRYLVNSPPHPKERAHKLRLACGNGLRPDVWPEFKQRFHIPHILEFYAATEGNVLAVQLRRQGRRRRPHAVVSRAPLPDQGRALRRRDRAAGARRQRLLHRMRRRRARRGDRQDPQRCLEARQPASRAMPTRPRPRRRSCATCSRRATPGSAPAT